MELSQVVGIVTGGAAGLGQGFAAAILAGGGKVVITDVNAAQLEATGKAFQTRYGHKHVAWVRQNVTEPDSFHRAFDFATKFFDGPVNLLVNNAGIAGDLSFFDDGAPRNWESVVAIDLTAVVRGSQVAIDFFKKLPSGKEGVIVNIASLAGLNAVPFSPEYGAAKAGVVGLTRSLYPLKTSHNIRAVALCPGFAKTAMGKLATEQTPDYIAQMGGVMEIEDVVNAFKAALKEPDNAGRCLRIVQGKTSYYKFAGDKQLFPNSKL
ncbi:15-hydroxyprostaglandin dehydrogenase [Globisporangium polare]